MPISSSAEAHRFVAPLAPLAFTIAAGIVIDRFADPMSTVAWISMAFGFGLPSAFLVRRRSFGAVTILATYGALAGAWHHHRWSDTARDDLSLVADEDPQPALLRGVLSDVLGFRPGVDSDDPGITRAVLVIAAVRGVEGWKPTSGKVAVSVRGDRSDLRAGTAVLAAGRLSLVARPMNPGEFDYRAYLRSQGTRLRLMVDEPSGVWADESKRAGWSWSWMSLLGGMRAWSQEHLARGLDPRSAPLATALLLGRREGVDPAVNDAFARTGTTHLLAISGLHLQVLAVALGGSLRWLGLGRRPAFALVAAATVAYAVLVGMMPSVVRSATMTVTVCLAALLDRMSRPANTLSLAAIATLAHNPSDLFDVGCQLSFVAVASILWGVTLVVDVIAPSPDPLTELEHRFAPKWKSRLRLVWLWMVQGLVVSTVVWLAALPLTALRFHIVSPIGILLNVPLIPMTSLALLASGVSLGLAAVWEPLGHPAARLASLLLDGTEQVVRWGVAQPWGHGFVPEPSLLWVLGFYLFLGFAAAALVGRWPRRTLIVTVAAGWAFVGLALALLPHPSRPLSAEILSVGHGLAVVIETGNRGAVLYDCGRMRDPSVGRRVIASAIWARGIHKLDHVILSHADADHYNGLLDLLERVRVGTVIVSEGFASATNPGAVELLERVRARGVAVRSVVAGESWSSGPARFAILHPPHGWNPSAPDNARSLVLDVSSLGHHALLTGDLEGEGLTEFAASRLLEPIDAFLAPHHGGRAANPAWLYERISPAVVVVSQRPPQPGFKDSLDFLDDRGIPVMRTWRRGAVRMTWKESGIVARGFLDD